MDLNYTPFLFISSKCLSERFRFYVYTSWLIQKPFYYDENISLKLEATSENKQDVLAVSKELNYLIRL